MVYFLMKGGHAPWTVGAAFLLLFSPVGTHAGIGAEANRTNPMTLSPMKRGQTVGDGPGNGTETHRGNGTAKREQTVGDRPLENLGRFEILGEEPVDGAKNAEIQCEAVDSATGKALPLRVVVTASDGSHLDGAGRGLYSDGRFFADGNFTVRGPAGATKILLRSGPEYVPLTLEVTAKIG
ncbi:MAG: hypothetical protein JWL77_3440, partial [Chthonomonadaceae bacterium]|nr:hypothetical protein [Chthonomonadaceae bacterium]